jgi:peptide/nickel transport system ATP-binding protein
MALVVVKNLRKTFPLGRGLFSRQSYVVAVDNVSFEVDRGEVFGLVGESGSGKTTCGKLLVRLLEPTSGSIFYDGIDITKLRGGELMSFRRKVQMIFQDPYESLNPRFTVFDAVVEPLVIQGLGNREERRGRVLEALRKVKLTPPEDFLARYPHELSGGQRQRVAIARALVTKPSFVVADEPVSMLDVSIRAGILNLMLELRDKLDLTMLFITHDLAVARYMCDRIGVMQRGRIVEVGEKEEIISSPKHPYTQELLTSVPKLHSLSRT